MKPSQSKPDRGTVRVHTRVLNQDGVLVAEFKRVVLVPRKDQPGDTGAADTGEAGDRAGATPVAPRPQAESGVA